ncbi:superoxide dismutase, Ni [Candidatus Woesearchaeota archaeon]|nr:superoxide dismutase, Ni [Candidatus Woesearchaeota archaeon]|tara:strand:- start:527 stop:967 length:441 start_codon:yes stop_codon:yes gene_type:complete
MNPIKTIARIADKLSEPKEVYAHCDVPCGIYETDTITHSVATIRAMTEKLLELQHPKENHVQHVNTAVRMISTKEEFSQKCKTEILILWTDYFKPEHLEKFPELHETVWKATKLCSEIKRVVDIKKVEELEKAVDEIKRMFDESKK